MVLQGSAKTETGSFFIKEMGVMTFNVSEFVVQYVISVVNTDKYI